MATTLKAFIQTAHGYLNQGASAETDLMFLLKELESLKPLWSKQHATWGTLLQDHQLCSYNRYSRFKVAAKEFRKSQFEKVGVSACILVAHVSKRHRSTVKDAVLAWSKKHGPVTSQRVNAIAQQVAPGSVSSMAYKQNAGVWRRHAHKLEAMLLEHGVVPPSLKEAATEDTVLDTSVALVRAKFRLKTVYPSCSDADLLRIATEQVETASGNLKTALQQNRPKSGAHTQSTRVFPNGMLDKIVLEQVPSSGGALISVDESMKALVKLDKAGMDKYKMVMSNRVLARMRACPKLEEVGKVGNRCLFRKRK